MKDDNARATLIASLRKLNFDDSHIAAALAIAEEEMEQAAYEASAEYFDRYIAGDRK